MPYINRDLRDMFEESIGFVVDTFVNRIDDNELRDGCLNYVISSLVSQLYSVNYKDINAAIGVLECVKLELYRRVAAPYEDTKIKQYGDVY